MLTQINALIFVGSETTAIGLSWYVSGRIHLRSILTTFNVTTGARLRALNFLALNPQVQQKLREELIACSSQHLDGASSTQSNILSLPYLDHVIKESLRLVPSVHSTVRAAAEDVMIPTSDGKGVLIRSGQFVHIAIEGFNTRKDVWGEDAFEFRPERWSDSDSRKATVLRETPGLIGGLMTFILGPHVRLSPLNAPSVHSLSCPGLAFRRVLGTNTRRLR